ncbi:MAG: hypothetical protein WC547_05725 [Candidatus Omnitrophota bacterium]
MNKELFMVFVPGISWILFSLGGAQISDKTPGWKGWRRFILPAVYLAAVIMVFQWWQAALVTGTAVAVYTFPYGDRTSWPLKALVGLGYGLISLPIGLSWWNVITAIGFIALFALSNTKITAKTFTWKICEGLFGLLVGIQVAYRLMIR